MWLTGNKHMREAHQVFTKLSNITVTASPLLYNLWVLLEELPHVVRTNGSRVSFFFLHIQLALIFGPEPAILFLNITAVMSIHYSCSVILCPSRRHFYSSLKYFKQWWLICRGMQGYGWNSWSDPKHWPKWAPLIQRELNQLLKRQAWASPWSVTRLWCQVLRGLCKGSS